MRDLTEFGRNTTPELHTKRNSISIAGLFSVSNNLSKIQGGTVHSTLGSNIPRVIFFIGQGFRVGNEHVIYLKGEKNG